MEGTDLVYMWFVTGFDQMVEPPGGWLSGFSAMTESMTMSDGNTFLILLHHITVRILKCVPLD